MRALVFLLAAALALPALAQRGERGGRDFGGKQRPGLSHRPRPRGYKSEETSLAR